MAILNLLSAAEITADKPGGLWSIIIFGLFELIKDYGWTIVVFTVLLKLVLSPLDIYQRYKARKNQRLMIKLRPQHEKLQKMYGNNPQLLQQKQMELNRKEGMSYFSSCLPSIVTLVIFITLLYTGLQPISQYYNFTEYQQLNYKYHELYDAEYDEHKALFDGQADAIRQELAQTKAEELKNATVAAVKEADYKKAYDAAVAEGKSVDEATALATSAAVAAEALGVNHPDYMLKSEEVLNSFTAAEIDRRAREKVDIESIQLAVKDYYEDEVQTSFLWIKNIWSADVPWTAPINDRAKFEQNAGKYVTDPGKAGLSEDELRTMLAEYDAVMEKLLNDPEYNKSNGYLVLPLLTIALSVAMQVISFRQQKKSGQTNAQSETTMKVMMLVMPVMMGWFSLSYTAAFSLYLVVNYMVSMIITLSSSAILAVIDKREDKKAVTTVHKYGRPDFSDKNNDKKKK